MQDEFIRFLVEINVCLIIGYVIFHLLFRKNHRHSWNRIFLIGWPLLSLIIATAQINWTVWNTYDSEQTILDCGVENMPLPDLEQVAPIDLAESSVTEFPRAPQTQNFKAFWQKNWRIFYWSGAFVLGLVLLFRLAHLRYLIRYATPIRKGSYTLLEHPKLRSIFSFGRYIFNPEGKSIHPMILEHELVHIRQGHSVDVLWMELLIIFNWFNPIIYFYRKHLKETHEFIADQSVMQQYGLLEYARLLVSQATAQKSPALGTAFAAFTKKRILTMKTKTNNPWSRLRYGVILPLFLVLMTAFAVNRVEKERPETKDAATPVTISNSAVAQVKWGNLTYDCFTGDLKGAYFCEINTVSRAQLEKLTKQVPNISINGESQSLLKTATQYSATIYKAESKRIGLPVEFAEGFFTPDDAFWSKLEPGDKVKFRATLTHGQVVEFPITLEGKHPEKVINSYLQNANDEVIPFDQMNLSAKLEMTLEEFEDFMSVPFSLMEDGKKVDIPISISGGQTYYGQKGAYAMMESSTSKDNNFKLEDLSLFHYISPGEILTLNLRPKRKKVGTLDHLNIYKLQIKIRGTHPVYQQQPKIVWNGREIDGTTFYIKAEEIEEFKNTLPQLFLNGRKFINNKESLLAKAIQQGNQPLDKYMIHYEAKEFQKLINQRLATIEELAKKNRKSPSFRNYTNMAQIGIPTPDGHLFPFEIKIEGLERDFDQEYKTRLEEQRPYFALPINKELIQNRSSGYGKRIHPITKKEQFHRGVDFVAPLGTMVKSAASGKVIKVEELKTGYGKHVIIQHAEGYQTVYGQLQSIHVQVGEEINHGQHIGTVGSSGSSTGPHLHFELLQKDKHLDPEKFLPSWKPKE